MKVIIKVYSNCRVIAQTDFNVKVFDRIPKKSDYIEYWLEPDCYLFVNTVVWDKHLEEVTLITTKTDFKP